MRKIKEINMGEILSAVRLKERILIIVLTLALALVVGGATFGVTYATIDNHEHEFTYELSKGEDGEFDLIETCVDEECEYHMVYFISNPEEALHSYEKVAPTCYSVGILEYYFTPKGSLKSYTYQEEIPMLSHSYVGEITTENGISSIDVSCSNEGCEKEIVSVGGITNVELVETTPATCHTPRKDVHTCKYGEDTITVTTYTEEEVEHKLNGEFASNFILHDNIYIFGTPGIVCIGTPGCGENVPGAYVCEECKETVGVKAGKPDHSYVYSAEDSTMPTLEAVGSATLKCENEGCDGSISVELPMAVEGENTVETGNNHILEERYLKYTYENTEYGFTAETEYTLTWLDHTLEYVPAETVNPTMTEQGKAYVRCSFEGCTKHEEITLPDVEVGANAVVVNQATEQRRQTIRYSYTDATYGFTVEFDLEIGEKLTHNYTYDIDLYGSSFCLIGTCAQPECQEPTIYLTDVAISEESFPATCTSYAYLLYSCEYEGNVYTEIMEFRFDGFGPHNLQYSAEESTMPTPDAEGIAVVKCVNEGCSERHEIAIPKMIIGENCESSVDHETGYETLTYTYTFEHEGVSYTVETTLQRAEPHDCVFTYELEPVLGRFDFVGYCNHPACDEEIREENVEATLIEDTTTCTAPGQQTWQHVRDNGDTYECHIRIEIVLGHSMTYNVDAATTVKPTFDAPGSIDLYCAGCGMHGATIELPKMVLGEGGNTVQSGETKFEIVYIYTHVAVYEEEEIPVALIITVTKN